MFFLEATSEIIDASIHCHLDELTGKLGDAVEFALFDTAK